MVPKVCTFGAFAFAAASVTTASASPTTTELDLIFPRDNETYLPTYPFPIVFAVQNPAPAWPFNFGYSWQLYPVSRLAKGGDVGQFPGAFESTSEAGEANFTGPLVHIYPTGELANTTEKEWFLFWRVNIIRNCTPSEDESRPMPTYAENLTAQTGAISFNISDDGKIPDVFQSGKDQSACPQPLWTVNIKGEADNGWMAYNQEMSTPTCPWLDPENPHPPSDPCAVRATEELARNVTQEMLARAQCIGVTSWPNTSLVGPCRDEGWKDWMSLATPIRSGARAGLIAAGILSFSLNFLL